MQHAKGYPVQPTAEQQDKKTIKIIHLKTKTTFKEQDSIRDETSTHRVLNVSKIIRVYAEFGDLYLMYPPRFTSSFIAI